jgi:uncharacterized membrane protein
MVDPMIVIPAGTACLGMWVLVTGRTFRGLPKWPLEGTSLRVAGVYDLVGSLFVIGISLAGGKGLAFITYAVLTLAFVAVVQGVPKLKPQS